MEEPNETDQRTLDFIEQITQSDGESDRGLVLFSAAHIDHYLRRILETFLIDDKSIRDLLDSPFAPFSTLSGKTRAAFAMGLISREEMSRIDAVRKVRNVFAHYIDASFEHEEVKELCAKPPIYDGRLCDRDAFLHMAMNTVPALIYRDIRVKTEWKRVELKEESSARVAADG